MKLYPEKVEAAVGVLVKFTCSYVSSEKLTIEFDETFYPTSADWHQPESLQISDNYDWGAEKYLVTRIRLGHKMVSCRVRNADGELLGTLSSMINPGVTSKYLPSWNLGASVCCPMMSGAHYLSNSLMVPSFFLILPKYQHSLHRDDPPYSGCHYTFC